MAEEYEEKDIYVVLDFQGKDTSKFLKQSDVYFKMLNLNEVKPIVEIGEDVYEGTYDDAVGTNVYFEEVENPPPNTNVFEGTTPITLKYLLKQTKILQMNKIGTKPKPIVNTNPTETVNINIKDDYRILLEKFENDTLNIEEYITTDSIIVNEKDENEFPSGKSEEEEEETEEEEHGEQWQSSQLPPRQSLIPEWYTSAQENNTLGASSQTQQSPKTKAKQEQSDTSAAVKHMDPTYMKYVKLQKLAEQPTRHKIKAELVEGDKFEQPLHSIPKNDFIVWKNLVMQAVEQQIVNLDINKDKIEDFVDIEKSVTAGIIAPSNANPCIFTKEEKQELLSFKNFINISPLMKLIMLQDYVQIEKASIAEMTPEELNTIGEDGCTVKERFVLLKNFKEELRSHIILRLQDGLASDESFTEQLQDNIPLNLSDNEEWSDTDFSYSSDDDAEDDEHQSDSKRECEGTSSGLSDSEQQRESQLEEGESSNVSDAEGTLSNTTNKQQNANKAVFINQSSADKEESTK